jgi:hypothetical protein
MGGGWLRPATPDARVLRIPAVATEAMGVEDLSVRVCWRVCNGGGSARPQTPAALCMRRMCKSHFSSSWQGCISFACTGCAKDQQSFLVELAGIR